MSFRVEVRAIASTITIAALVGFVASGCSRTVRFERSSGETNASSPNAININTATAKELAELPGIGETIARRIVEFREQNGAFRRPEHLLLVEGISEKRLREIRSMIKTE
jgi:competence protein ComEA